MVVVTITGWKTSANKIDLNHYLQDRTNMGLAEAKEIVDAVLEGQAVDVQFAMFSDKDAQALKELSWELPSSPSRKTIDVRFRDIANTRMRV